jgi:hypothetical protein
VTVVISPEGECKEFAVKDLWQRSQHGQQQMEQSKYYHDEEMDLANNKQFTVDDDFELARQLSLAESNGGGSVNRSNGLNGSKDASSSSGFDQFDNNAGGDAAGDRVLYKPKDDDWEFKEMLLLSELERRQRKRDAQPLEPEPAGIDGLYIARPDSDTLNSTTLPANTRIEDGIAIANASMKSVQVGTQVRRGFDLVRVGNFHEDPTALQVKKHC